MDTKRIKIQKYIESMQHDAKNNKVNNMDKKKTHYTGKGKRYR